MECFHHGWVKYELLKMILFPLEPLHPERAVCVLQVRPVIKPVRGRISFTQNK